MLHERKVLASQSSTHRHKRANRTSTRQIGKAGKNLAAHTTIIHASDQCLSEDGLG